MKNVLLLLITPQESSLKDMRVICLLLCVSTAPINVIKFTGRVCECVIFHHKEVTHTVITEE